MTDDCKNHQCKVDELLQEHEKRLIVLEEAMTAVKEDSKEIIKELKNINLNVQKLETHDASERAASAQEDKDTARGANRVLTFIAILGAFWTLIKIFEFFRP